MESQRYLHKCHVQLLFVQAARALMKLKHHAPQCLPLMPGYRKCFQGGLYLTISACEMDRTFLVWLDCESDQRLSHPRVVNKFNTNYIIFLHHLRILKQRNKRTLYFIDVADYTCHHILMRKRHISTTWYVLRPVYWTTPLLHCSTDLSASTVHLSIHFLFTTCLPTSSNICSTSGTQLHFNTL